MRGAILAGRKARGSWLCAGRMRECRKRTERVCGKSDETKGGRERDVRRRVEESGEKAEVWRAFFEK